MTVLKEASNEEPVQKKHLIYMYGPYRYNCNEKASNVEQTSI